MHDQPPAPHIRWLIRRDLPEVTQVSTKLDQPWFEEDIMRCLRQRNVIGMVAEQGERVVGFMIYELYKHRLHVLVMAVHPDHRRQGIGTKMFQRLCAKLSPGRRIGITGELPETSLSGQLFCRAMNLKAIKTLKSAYPDYEGEDDRDGVRFQYAIAKFVDLGGNEVTAVGDLTEAVTQAP